MKTNDFIFMLAAVAIFGGAPVFVFSLIKQDISLFVLSIIGLIIGVVLWEFSEHD